MKVVFMGTPDFAVPAFRRLAKEHQVLCVYTREPKISGRGNKLNKTPVHLAAEEYGIEVRTPKTLRTAEEQQKFADLKADVAVVAAYGLILPNAVLKAYPLGCLNLHASLLPRWRGAAPIQRCVEAGDKQSGVTIMQIAEGLDTGDMLHKGVVAIDDNMTGGELHDKLMNLGADLISEVLANPQKYVPQKQDDSLACYAQKLEKEECKADFSMQTEALYNKIRAFNPYPAMYFEYKGERFKILQAEKLSLKALAGTIIKSSGELIVATGDGALKITQIQRQGKRPMPTEELLRGFTFEEDSFI